MSFRKLNEPYFEKIRGTKLYLGILISGVINKLYVEIECFGKYESKQT